MPISIRPKCHGDVASRLREYGTWEIAIEVKKNGRLIELATRMSRSFAPSCEFGSMHAHINVYMSTGTPSIAVRREKNARFQSESSSSNTRSSPCFNPSQLTSELEKPVLRIAGGLFECEVIEEREVLQEAELSGQADSENDLGGSSETMYFIGLDVHKKTISYCVKDAAGRVYQEGKIGSSRRELDVWIRTMPQPRMIAMEATIFTGWIYDHLLPHAEKVKVAHPLLLRAIAAAKRKNDKIDAGKIADCLRCDFLPECHMASTEIRDRRRTLRYRSLVVKQMVQMKNRVSGLLMETGVNYNKQRLHKVGYFKELMTTNQDVHESIRPLLKLSREMISRSQKLDYALISSLERDPLLKERLRRLRTVPGVGPITAVTWALEIGDFTRFTSNKQAISYCGLCGDEKSSADKIMRMPSGTSISSAC